MSSLYLGLVHHPIRNKIDELVTTSVTNLDIHDISRSCRTFGVERYFIITPLVEQHKLVQRILGHWSEDKSSAYNPDRHEALKQTELQNSIADAAAVITEIEGQAPKIVATGANFESFDLKSEELNERLKLDKTPYFLLFGTGWGLHKTVLETVDHFLEPLYGASSDGYNHLSVRSAVAIYLDRLKR